MLKRDDIDEALQAGINAIYDHDESTAGNKLGEAMITLAAILIVEVRRVADAFTTLAALAEKEQVK